MSTPASLIGATLGAYQVQSLLGSGGMATVYQGFDQNLHRSVAIKVLSAVLAADPAYVDRFRQEARLIASLRHPHIAQVYAFGEHAGTPYMVQELLPGPTLEQHLKDLAAAGERMPQPAVLATIAQLASALDAAHAVGVIHRDVKPANALYNAQQQLVLTDFGIARSVSNSSGTATEAGVVMGTPGYVAPEQAISSASLTPACDVYALGVVLFELLTGRLPFVADTPMDVVLKHLYEPPPPPSALRPELPPAVDTVVLRALEKEPPARYASAGALAQAFAAAWPLQEAPALADAVPDVHSQPTRIWAGASAGAARPAQPPAQAPAASPAGQPAAPPATGGRRWLLPFLGLLLIGLFIAGGVLASRAGQAPGAEATPATAPPTTLAGAIATTPADTVAPASSPTQAAASPTATTAPATPTAAPTTTPAPATATTAPATPTAAPATPTIAPTSIPAPADPVADLRSLLVGGIAAGQVEEDGEDLLKRVDEVERAIADDNTQKASEHLRELQKKIEEWLREEKIDPGLGEQALASISLVADTYELRGVRGD